MGSWGPQVTLEENGGVPVNIQDQVTLALDLFFLNSIGQTTLTADVAPNDRVLSLTSVAGVAVGGTIGLGSGAGNFYFGDVLSINVLDVTVDTPVDHAFLSASSAVIIADKHLNVVGTPASPVIFQVGPVGPAIVVDITRVMGQITDATSMDDAKFGGLTRLVNGIILRQHNGAINNYWNVKSNGELGLLCFDFSYADRAPSGFFGLKFRNTYAGQAKHGVAIRLEAGETLELLVQDDLTGLTDFTMMAQGHIVTD